MYMKDFLTKVLQWKLELLAKLTIRRYEPGVVAVTGSVGKTSTKEAIRACLAGRFRIRAAAKSFNNELGVPLTIVSDATQSGGAWFWIRAMGTAAWNLVVKHSDYPEALVLEYAIDRPGDMDRLVRIATPDVAVVTAIGDVPVHVEFFAGPEAVLHEKAKLVKVLTADGFAVLNADDPKVAGVRDLTRAHVVTYGFSEGADVRLSNLKNVITENGDVELRFKLSYRGTVVPVRIPHAVGTANAYAASAAAAVGIAFGMNLVEIAEGLEAFAPPAGRFKVLRGVQGITLIDSTYNASPLAMEEALDTLKSLEAPRRIAVVGDMLELGKFTLPAHEEAGKRAVKSCDVLITVGHMGKFIAEAALAHGMPKGKVHSFASLADVAACLKETLKPRDLVLFKASQGVRLERVLKQFLADSASAGDILVRQDRRWRTTAGLYDEGELE